MAFGTGMARFRSVAIFLTAFCLSPPNESDGTVGFGSTKIEILSQIY